MSRLTISSVTLRWTATVLSLSVIAAPSCAPSSQSSPDDVDSGLRADASVFGNPVPDAGSGPIPDARGSGDTGTDSFTDDAAVGPMPDAWVPLDSGGDTVVDAGFDPQTCTDILDSLLAPFEPKPFPAEGVAVAFVYGTLLAGERNHHYMGSSELVGTARTVPCFQLYDLGSYPGMAPTGDTQVLGEVYRVTEATRDALDQLEGHPDYYRRVEIPVGMDADGSIQSAETYLLRPSQVSGDPVIASGDWRNP